MTLTVAEIYDLACFAGFTINHSPLFMPDEDEMETEITVMDCPSDGLIDDDGITRIHYTKAAYFAEYPEEGSIGLGKELAASRNGLRPSRLRCETMVQLKGQP